MRLCKPFPFGSVQEAQGLLTCESCREIFHIPSVLGDNFPHVSIAGALISGYLERLAYTVQDALDKARQSIAEIMARPLEMRESVKDILQNIASGNAPGRQEGILCLMTAAGFACPDADRSCCIGCGYKIYTKAIIRLLLSEYTRLVKMKTNAGEAEVTRYDAILKKAVTPAMSEMLFAAERLYPGANMRPLLNELRRGMTNASH
jgi:hypothetical protein